MDIITNTLDKCDALAYYQMERLNYGGDKEHKSSVGGCCTICLLIALVVLTAWKGSQLFQYDGTYQYEGDFSPDEEMFIHESTMQFFFGLWDMVKGFDIDSTKIEVFIEHKFFYYDQDGNKTVTETRYDIRKCTSSDFNKTQWERDQWKNIQPSEDNEFEYHLYCIDDPNNTLSLHGPGLLDDLDKGKNTSKMYVKVERCQNSSATVGTSLCSTPEEIDD